MHKKHALTIHYQAQPTDERISSYFQLSISVLLHNKENTNNPLNEKFLRESEIYYSNVE